MPNTLFRFPISYFYTGRLAVIITITALLYFIIHKYARII